MTQERDAELSALLDGALSARDETLLRAEIALDPALAARLAELARVDEELRALPARPVPLDLRARLQAKLDADVAVRPQLGVVRGGAFARIRRRRAWAAGFAAAAAAALVAVVGLPGRETGEATPEIAVAVIRPPSDERRSLSEAVPIPDAEALAALPGEMLADPSEVQASGATEIAGQEIEPDTSLPGATGPQAVAALASEQAAPGFADATDSVFEPELAARTEAGPTPQLAASASAPLLVELSDDEAEALDALELGDTGVVAVLDLLDELDALEAGAS